MSTIAEERQDQNAKRRKLDQQSRSDFSAGPSQTLGLKAPVPNSTSNVPSLHPSLPQRPSYDFAANADSIGLGAAPTTESIQNVPTAAQALAGSNRDVVANRRAIRMANMSAAEVLKAELSGLSPLKPSASSLSAPPQPSMQVDQAVNEESSIPGLGPPKSNTAASSLPQPSVPSTVPPEAPAESDADADGDPDPDAKMASGDTNQTDLEDDGSSTVPGTKRKFEEGPGSDDVVEDVVVVEEDDEESSATPALKVNPDGTVEQEDTVKYVPVID